MSEGQQTNNRFGGAAFWGWTVSVILHAAVLLIFAGVTFSQRSTVRQDLVAPTTKISGIQKFLEYEPIAIKPKVKKIVSYSAGVSSGKPTPVTQIFNVPKAIVQSDAGLQSGGSEVKPMLVLSSSAIVSPKVEFFGSLSDERKICYVVDCSGSMRGMFSRVRKELIESIDSLAADRYFYVIFFSSGRLIEYGDGRLVRATPESKAAVCEFVKAVEAAGSTNAMAALERAMEIRDSSGMAPAVIYFLTDGFELTSDNAYRFADEVLKVRKSLAPAVKINTIGFWVQSDDGVILKRIAKQTGGECVLIN